MAMKSVFKRWLNHVVVLLGFSTCGMMTGCVMYGVPNVDYKITGTVTDEENNPIEGIRVTLPQLNANLERIWNYDLSQEDMSQWSAEDIARWQAASVPLTMYTDEKGRFNSGVMNMMDLEPSAVIFEDVDGEANGGSFATDSLTADEFAALPDKRFKRGHGWYGGAYERVVDIQLKKK